MYVCHHHDMQIQCTVVPAMNGHPRDQAKVSVHCRWPLIRGNLTLKCVGRGIDNVAVQGRWPLTTGIAQGRYYCTRYLAIHRLYLLSYLLSYNTKQSYADMFFENEFCLLLYITFHYHTYYNTLYHGCSLII